MFGQLDRRPDLIAHDQMSICVHLYKFNAKRPDHLHKTSALSFL
jgi:hypothetical protein